MSYQRASKVTKSMRKRGWSEDGHPPVPNCDAEELHGRLVEDAVARRATDLAWAVMAYDRIGELSGRGPEHAFQEVRADIESRTGSTVMPMM